MPRLLSRRKLLVGSLAALGLGGTAAYALRARILAKIAKYTQSRAFSAPPPLVPHDPARDQAKVFVARGGSPAANLDTVLTKLGGIDQFVGAHDVVIIKVSAQWWNQGMTNVAAVKRTIEQILARPGGFTGEIVVFENTHFRLADGSGLSRAWTHPSERNVDVEGWNKLGDLVPHFKDAPVSFVGLVDAGPSELSDAEWHDPGQAHGRYGGDGRGPIEPGSDRDGYHWDFARTFRLARSWVDEARTPLTWPRFTSPRSGLVVDLAAGVLERVGGKLVPTDRKLTWICMTTANEHGATGYTGACKATMGIVDMSAGALGTHPRAKGYQSVHYFGQGRPEARWRMAGPLAYFARQVRAPNLIITVAEWVAFQPIGYAGAEDIRHAAETCVQKQTIVAGTDPVAIDTWAAENLLHDVPSANRAAYFDLGREDAMLTKFLRYYRQVYGLGTMDSKLIEVV